MITLLVSDLLAEMLAAAASAGLHSRWAGVQHCIRDCQEHVACLLAVCLTNSRMLKQISCLPGTVIALGDILAILCAADCEGIGYARAINEHLPEDVCVFSVQVRR